MGSRSISGPVWPNKRPSPTGFRPALAEALEQRTFLSVVAGPDAYGYTASVAPPPSAAVLTQTTPGVEGFLLTGTDDGTAPLNLGANTFTFYGQTYSGSDLNIGANGLITFGTALDPFVNSADLSIPAGSSSSPAAIAPLWADWTTSEILSTQSDGQVLRRFDDLNGDGTPDQLTIQWDAVHHASDHFPFLSPGTVTFQAILQLNTPHDGSILFNYVNLASGDATAEGGDATVGIRAAAPSSAPLLISYSGSNAAVGTGKAILIRAGNQAPVANADAYTTNESAPLVVGAPAGVLGNDSDPDGNPITAMTVATPTHGQLALDSSGAFTYTPDLGFSGTDSFKYVASDGQELSAPATVSISVIPVGTAPTVTASDASGVEGSPVPLGLSAALVDNDGSETLGVQITGVPSVATLSAGTNQGGGVWSLAPEQLSGLTLTSPDDASANLTITATATESANGSAASTSESFHVTVANANPVAATPSVSPPAVDEGGAVVVSGSFSDAGALDAHTVTINFGDGSAPVSATVNETTKTYFASHRYADDTGSIAGDFPITATVLDDDGGSGSASAAATVRNVAPTIVSVTTTVDPVAMKTVVSASAQFTDPGVLDTHKAIWDWGDGTSSGTVGEPGPGQSGTVVGSHAYAAAGTYTVRLTVADDDGGEATGTSKNFVVVYDPSAGFVTGGGWIDSPAGANVNSPTATGKGRFGFVSKYQNGTTTPTGQTQFTLNVANLSFHSTAYDWMVVTGGRADYHGAGTINGLAGYHFQLTAIDGGSTADGIDRVRLRIWCDATGSLVYDNGLGAPDDNGPGTALAGGSIVIHA